MLGILFGCGKKKPADTSDTPGPSVTPPAGGPNTTPPKADPVTGKPKDSVKVLSPRNTFKPDASFTGSSFNRVFITDDGTRLAIGLDDANKTQIWDISAEPKKLKEFPGKALAFSPDGKIVIRGTSSYDLEVVDALTGTLVRKIPDPGLWYTFPTPDVFLTVFKSEAGGKDKQQQLIVREYDTSTWQKTSEFEVPADFGKEIYNWQIRLGLNGGRQVAFGNTKTRRVQIWDIKTRKIVSEYTLGNPTPSPNSFRHFIISLDGKWVSAEDKGTEIFDGKTGKTIVGPPREGFGGRLGGTFLPTRDMFIHEATHLGDNGKSQDAYRIYDIQGKSGTAFLPGGGSLFACSANGKVMVTVESNGELRVWDLTQLP